MLDPIMANITIAVADHQVLYQAGLLMLLENEDGFEVVGSSEDATATVHLVNQLEPDVVLVNPELPGGGLLCIKNLRNSVSSKFLAISNQSDASWVRAAMASGTHGYMLTADSPEYLFSAIRALHAGRVWLSFALDGDLRSLVENHVDPKLLPPREAEVLTLMALGATYKRIAEDLGMSTKTIESYRTRICERLNLKSRADLVRYCLETGLLVSPTSP